MILDAARRLFLNAHGSLPSVAAIAADAGLAKGTLYLYFQSKKAVFAALLHAEWTRLLDAVDADFGDATGSAPEVAAQFVSRFTDYLDTRPLLLRLDALSYSILERNIDGNALRALKRDFAARLTRSGAIVDRALALPSGRGLALLTRSYAMARGLWQSSDYPERLADLMREPEIEALAPAFAEELRQALTQYWRGALSV